MKAVHIITPVKDSIELSLQTIEAVCASEVDIPHHYTVYDDFSTPANRMLLAEASQRLGFELVHLADLTTHPSPNYLLVLQRARQRALEEEAALLIVESDVVVRAHTLQGLVEGARSLSSDCGIAAAVTVDETGAVNYPYLYARRHKSGVFPTTRHCSFCCSLLSLKLLQRIDFQQLDASKNWYDVTLSHQAVKEGLRNYLFTSLPVWHRPHGSRPWKQLKYRHPLRYYWLKYTRGLDKI
jgi:hypothetical protein